MESIKHSSGSNDNTSLSSSSSSSKEKSAGGKMKFSSTLGTIVTLLGFSVGTSDFWRFPFLVYRNGGGAFLIPFVITVLICGLPLYFLEFSISSFSGKGPYKLWDMMPLFRGTSYSIVFTYAVFIVFMSVFRCWMVEFLVNSFQSPLPWSVCDNDWNTLTCRTGVANGTSANITASVYGNTTLLYGSKTAFRQGNSTMHFDEALTVYDNATYNNSSFTTPRTSVSGMSAAEEFWQYHVLDLSSGICDFGAIEWKYVLYNFVQRVIVIICCYKSIKSIEKVMYVSTFGPILLVTAIFIRSLMLPGAVDGIKHFFYTDFTKLAEPRIWVEASLMAFYTISFGWGAIVMMGSHSAFNGSVLRTPLVVTIIDAAVAVYNGVICFSVLGNMAHTLGSPVDQVINAGMSVGMVAYPSAIASLPAPQVWSAVFFVSLLLQGFDGQFLAIEMFVQQVAFVYPSFAKRSRMVLLILVSSVIFVCGLPLCTRAGGYIFLFLDWYTGVWVGPVVSLIELIAILWIYGGDRFSYDVSFMLGRPLPAAMRICLAFITPVIVLTMLVVSLVSYVPPAFGDYSYPLWARGLGWVIVTLSMAPIVAYIVWLGLTNAGGFLQNLRQSLKPLDSWGPAEDSGVVDYIKQPPNRSRADLATYNVLGRYRKRIKTTAAQEMNLLT